MKINKLFFLLPLFLIFGCSFFSDEDGSEKKEIVAPLVKIEAPTASLDVVWSVGIGDMGSDSLSLSLTPAMVDDKIYAVNAVGKLRSIDRATGSVNWVATLDKQITSAVGAGSGLVIVVDEAGGVNALSSSDGIALWRAQASSEVLAAPATNGDVVVVQSIDSRVQAFDVKSGKPRWIYSASQSVLTLRGNSAPVIVDNVVYVAFDNGKAAAIDANTGLLQWERRFLIPDGRSEIERVIDVQANPLVIDTEVFVGAYQGSVVCLDRSTGQPKWQEKSSVAQSMTSSDGNLNIVESGDTVKALRVSNGREAWNSAIFSGRKLSSPATIGSFVAIADMEGYIHLLSQSDGIYSGRFSVGGNGVRADILSDGIYLYVLNNSGKLSALRLEN